MKRACMQSRHRISCDRLAIQVLVIAALMYTSIDMWQTLTWPPFHSFDETAEIDYVYQLTQGHLPTFWGGVTFNPLNLQYPYDVQWRYQHPPLFYILEIPFFLLGDTISHPFIGIWIMRGFVYILGLLLIVSSFWAARWLVGHKNSVVYLVPLLIACNRCLPSVVFNYTLASLWVTLLIGMTAKLLRTSSDKQSCSTILLWTVTVGLAPLTRLSTVPIMALCLSIITVSLISRKLHSKPLHKEWLTLVALPAVISIASSAWFYLRLYALSGSFTGSQPAWSAEHLSRTTDMTFTEALMRSSFYKNSFSQYHNMSSINSTHFGWFFVVSLSLIPLVLGLAVFAWNLLGKMHRAGNHDEVRNDSLILVMCLLALFGTTAQQLLYSKQGGSDNAVYFSLINIIFAFTIASGFCRFKRITPWIVSVWLLIHLGAFLYEAKLTWPLTAGGTLEQAGDLARIGIYAALLLAILSTLCGVSLFLSHKFRPYSKIRIQ